MVNKPIAQMIKEFDEDHVIKQIILIGEDGHPRNIELGEFEEVN